MAGEYLPPVVAELKADIADFLAKIEEAKIAMRSLKDESSGFSLGSFDDTQLHNDLQDLNANLRNDLYDMRQELSTSFDQLGKDFDTSMANRVKEAVPDGFKQGRPNAEKAASDSGSSSGNAFTKAFKNKWVALTASGLIPGALGMAGGLASGLLGGITGTLGLGLSAIAAKYALTLAEANTTFAANWSQTKTNIEQYLSNRMAPAFGELGKTVGSLVNQSLPAVGGIFTNLLQGFNMFLKAGAPAIHEFLLAFESLSGVIEMVDRQFGQDLSPLLQGIINLVQPMFSTLEQVPSILKDTLSGLGVALTGLGQGLNAILIDGAPLITATFNALGPLLDQLGVAIGQLVAGLGPFVTVLGHDLVIVLAALGPALGTVVTALSTDLTPILNMLAPILAQVVKLLGNGLTAVLIALLPVINQLVPMVGQLARGFLVVANQALLDLLPLLPPLAKLLVQVLVNMAPMIPQFNRMLQAILPLLPPLVTLVVDLLNLATWLERVVGGPMNRFVTFIEGKMVTAIAALGTGLGTAVSYTTQHFIPAMERVANWFEVDFPKPFVAVGNWFSGPFVNFFVRTGGAIESWWTGTVYPFIQRIPGDILKVFSGMGNLLFDAGKNLIGGFKNGISSAIGGVKSLLGTLTSKLTSWKGPPSLDMRILRPSGQMVLQGFMDGLNDMTPSVERTLRSLTGRIPAYAGVTAVGGYGSSSYGGNQPVHIHVNAGTVLYNEQQFANAVVQALQRWGSRTTNANISFQSVRGRKSS